jgi:hypothetical protein
LVHGLGYYRTRGFDQRLPRAAWADQGRCTLRLDPIQPWLKMTRIDAHEVLVREPSGQRRTRLRRCGRSELPVSGGLSAAFLKRVVIVALILTALSASSGCEDVAGRFCGHPKLGTDFVVGDTKTRWVGYAVMVCPARSDRPPLFPAGLKVASFSTLTRCQKVAEEFVQTPGPPPGCRFMETFCGLECVVATDDIIGVRCRREERMKILQPVSPVP